MQNQTKWDNIGWSGNIWKVCMLGGKNSGWFIGWGGDELLEASWHGLNKYVDEVEVVKVVGGFRTKIL